MQTARAEPAPSSSVPAPTPCPECPPTGASQCARRAGELGPAGDQQGGRGLAGCKRACSLPCTPRPGGGAKGGGVTPGVSEPVLGQCCLPMAAVLCVYFSKTFMLRM